MGKQPSHRVRTTTPSIRPPQDSPEGRHAAWWREHVIKLSRPALGQMLGLDARTIERYEAMATVPIVYRLACAAVQMGNKDWAWQAGIAESWPSMHESLRSKFATLVRDERTAFEKLQELQRKEAAIDSARESDELKSARRAWADLKAAIESVRLMMKERYGQSEIAGIR